MIRHIIDSRLYLTLILTVGIGTVLIQHFPFPDDNAVLQLVAAEKPVIFVGIKYAYQAILFSTPFIGCSMLFSLLYIFFVRPREVATLAPLPPYPQAGDRDRLFLVVGELHHPKRPEPAEEPRWLTIPHLGTLYRHCHPRSHRLSQDQLLYLSLRRANPGVSSWRSGPARGWTRTRSQR
jgi:hypothetical protein